MAKLSLTRLLDRVRLSLTLNRWRLELLRRLKGGILWTRRGGYWLPFHGDGDLQEIQYQLEGELWFKYETERLSEYLSVGAVVVDVGANLGFTALLFAKLVGPRGQIYAFEPSPPIYAKLLQVVEKNQLANVRCFNLGCGAARKRETLLVPASSGNATIRRSGVSLPGACRELNIEIDTLDHVILALAPRVDLLKIDTEGFEDQVLAGAEEIIARHRPVVYIELSLEYGDSSARAIAWLRERGYAFTRDPDLTSAHNGDNFIAFPAKRSASSEQARLAAHQS
ncbi:MAG: FkbM family methyltransferase [Verrucomicrobiota bacterium]|nr:FkbM family methyltransferase [Verrucomicrobiota bacterium]